MPHEAKYSVEFAVLALEVEVHHPLHKAAPVLEQLKQVILHLWIQLAEVAFDQESVKLEAHALVRLVSVVLQHALKQLFKVDDHLFVAVSCVG